MSETQPPNRSRDADLTSSRTSKAGLESTQDLLHRARRGDSAARETLAARYLPALRHFAHGRLPARARGMLDTDDLVQSTIMRALAHLERFEPRHQGSLLAYLRQILLNQVRDEARRTARLPREENLSEEVRDPALSPVEDAIGHEAMVAYERALAKLAPDCQEAITLRLEMGCSYGEIAEAQGRSSANAARLYTTRALLKLVRLLRTAEYPP